MHGKKWPETDFYLCDSRYKYSIWNTEERVKERIYGEERNDTNKLFEERTG